MNPESSTKLNNCRCCHTLNHLASIHIKTPKKIDLTSIAIRALLHLAYWLTLPDNEKKRLGPHVEYGKLCIRKRSFSKTNLILFANKYLHYTYLASLKEDPRMRIQWFFSNTSRKLKVLNPLSQWLVIEKNRFVPYDISTTCEELKKLRPNDCSMLSNHDTIIRVDEMVHEQMQKAKLTPVHMFLKLLGTRIELNTLLDQWYYEYSAKNTENKKAIVTVVKHLDLNNITEAPSQRDAPRNQTTRKDAITPRPTDPRKNV